MLDVYEKRCATRHTPHATFSFVPETRKRDRFDTVTGHAARTDIYGVKQSICGKSKPSCRKGWIKNSPGLLKSARLDCFVGEDPLPDARTEL